MLGFNINLDLSVYFDDLRKFSSVFVDISKFKNVGDVEQHIKLLFKLKDEISLVHEKFLLPKFEDSQVLRQCGTIQVQLCDFIDAKNDKKDEENCPSNNLALNLIQSEKTVDLSCKPKQRLKSNINNSHCKDNAVSTYCDGRNEIKKVSQSFCTCSKSHSKDKHKKKKKKEGNNNSESLFQYIDEDSSDSDILDMSVNKVKKTSHDNCFLPSEDCISSPYIVNDKLNSSEKYEISIKKQKKRKRQPDFSSEDLIVSNSIAPLASNEFVSNQKKSKKSSKSEDVSENSNTRASHVKCSHKKSKTYQTKNKYENLQFEQKDFQEIQNDCSSNAALKNYNYAEGGYDSEKCLNEKKKLYQNHIDTLLDSKMNYSSAQVLFENGEVQSTNYTVSMGEHKDLQNNSLSNHVSQNKEGVSQNGNQNAQSFLESSNTKVKRKRVRRHRQNKKSSYLEAAVGPVLQNIIIEQNEEYKSSTPSTSAKHIYFGDKDCDKKTMVDNTISRSLETSMQGLFKTNNCNTSQELESKECLMKWQEELLKLASAPKPIVYQRVGTPQINIHQTNNLHSQEHSQVSQSPDHRNQNGPCFSPCTTVSSGNVNNEHVKSCNIEENDSKVENLCTHEATITSENSIKPISIDLQNIKLSNYPVIDKVVSGDFILFQMLKLNENYEPDVSKVVLAKVKCSMNFPEISLEIIEGLKEFELSTRADTISEEAVVELSWNDLIEPRIFYP